MKHQFLDRQMTLTVGDVLLYLSGMLIGFLLGALLFDQSLVDFFPKVFGAIAFGLVLIVFCAERKKQDT